jgi:hypothetical protein
MAVFWVIAPCSPVEVYRRFRGPYCLHHQGDDNGSDDEGNNISEMSVNFYQTTRRNNSEDSRLRTRRRENLKSLVMQFIHHTPPTSINEGSTHTNNPDIKLTQIILCKISSLTPHSSLYTGKFPGYKVEKFYIAEKCNGYSLWAIKHENSP